MNEYALRMERNLRTLRDRVEMQIPSKKRETCIALYLIGCALDTADTANAGESAYEMQLPPDIPKRDWCKDCDGSCKRP